MTIFLYIYIQYHIISHDMAMIPPPHLRQFLPRHRSLDAQVQLAGLEGRCTRHARGPCGALQEVGAREAEGGASGGLEDANVLGIEQETRISMDIPRYFQAAEEKDDLESSC